MRETHFVAKNNRSQRQDQADATRGVILETALQLFSQQGYGSTSTRQIAEVAGVSEGLIFHHFDTKAHLFRAIPEQRGRLPRELHDLLLAMSDRPLNEVMASLVDQFVGLLAQEMDLVRVVLSESATDSDVGNVFRDLLLGFEADLASYLTGRQDAGEMSTAVPASSAARALIGALFYFVLISRDEQRQDLGERARRHANEVLAVWLDGVSR